MTRGCPPAPRTVSLVNHVVHSHSYPETIEEEGSEVGSPCDEDPAGQVQPGGKPCGRGSGRPAGRGMEQPPPGGPTAAPAPQSEDRDAVEVQKRRRLEQAGIRVRPAARRFARLGRGRPAARGGRPASTARFALCSAAPLHPEGAVSPGPGHGSVKNLVVLNGGEQRASCCFIRLVLVGGAVDPPRENVVSR